MSNQQHNGELAAAYDYPLPPERIAKVPAEPRRSARLLVDLRDTIVDSTVAELPRWLRPGDLVVVNDSRVIPARVVLARRSGGRVEALLLGRGESGMEALLKPGGRLKPGEELLIGDTPVLRIQARAVGTGSPAVWLVDVIDEALLAAAGEVPLPPYLRGVSVPMERYQTVYARKPGSVAAPTAGLHLDDQVLGALGRHGIGVVALDLQVGLGTFAPVKVERLDDHQIHSERYEVSGESWRAISSASRIIAIGTTVVRALETVAITGELAGESRLFIKPGFDFQIVNVLLTNFHVPRSTLLALVAAATGDRWRELYRHALEHDYRFLSFGDAMLIPVGRR